MEEGDGSLHKPRSHPIKMYQMEDIGNLVQKYGEYAGLYREMINNNYNKESIKYLKTLKGTGHPSFVNHIKYKGCVCIRDQAFEKFPNRVELKKFIEIKRQNAKRDECIFYLPSKYTKAPYWIRSINKANAKIIAHAAIRLSEDFDIKKIVLKEHPSTSLEVTSAIKKILEKKVKVRLWKNHLEENNITENIHEAAMLQFRYAIFSCKSSAISYTRTLSPNTQLLFTSFFGDHQGEIK